MAHKKKELITVEIREPGTDNIIRTFKYMLRSKTSCQKAAKTIYWALTKGYIVTSGEQSAMEKDMVWED